jgi:hypothetical protein
MARERLTIAEAALLNAVGSIAADQFSDPDRFATMCTVIEDVLPDVDRSHPRVSLLAQVAVRLMGTKTRTRDFALAKADAQRVACEVLAWRAACAHDTTRRKAGAA